MDGSGWIRVNQDKWMDQDGWIVINGWWIGTNGSIINGWIRINE